MLFWMLIVLSVPKVGLFHDYDRYIINWLYDRGKYIRLMYSWKSKTKIDKQNQPIL